MLDAHVHIERGPYTREWIFRFIEAALNAHIDTLYLLEHSSRFYEFWDTYTTVRAHPQCGGYQTAWLTKKCSQHLADYHHLIEQIKQEKLPLDVKFGLEVCYFPEHEQTIRQVVSAFPWDFLTGSIHWIDGWGFDHTEQRDTWQDKDVDQVYRDYCRLLTRLADSRLFDIVAHPDSIKCFDYYPGIDLQPEYHEFGRALKRSGMAAEQSGGLHLNYDHDELGMNPILLRIIQEEGVSIVTASDAHRPEDVGKNINALWNRLTD
jgi:histidinol-phosphatase (PHP family)